VKFEDLDLREIGHKYQLAGAVYSDGVGPALVCVFPEEMSGVDAFDRLDMSRDEWTQFLRQADLLEIEVMAKAKDGKVAKAVIRKCQRQTNQNVSWAVYRRDNFACRYCGNDQVPMTVDHLVTWEEGGPWTEDNLVASCKKCNKIRGNLPYAKWLNHPHYKKNAKRLTDHIRGQNLNVLDRLDSIPRMVHKQSR
jgi:hypothetical protein